MTGGRVRKFSSGVLARSLALYGLLALVAAWVAYGIFSPLGIVYRLDDWNVLPERVWFPSNWNWLKHLLFFNQTRFTAVGDFALCRPGLFAWLWWQDVLFRAHPDVQRLIAALSTLFAFGCFFVLIRKSCGGVAAWVAAIYTLTAPDEIQLYVWPHINPYVLALGLYALGASLFIEIDERGKGSRWLLAAVVFLLAEMFHEFVAVSLAVLLLFELAAAFGRIDRTVRRRVAVLSTALAGYGVLVAAELLFLRPPTFHFNASVESWGWDRWYRILFAEIHLWLKLLYFMVPFTKTSALLRFGSLPFSTSLARLAIPALLVSAAALGAYFARFRSRASAVEKKTLALCALPLAVLTAGLIVRAAEDVINQGTYLPMLSYFLGMALAVLFVVSFRDAAGRRARFLGAAALLICIGSSVYSATVLHARNVFMARSDAEMIGLRDSLVAFFKAHPDRCYAGVFDPSAGHLLNQQSNIMLGDYECGWKSGLPAYFLASGEAYQIPPRGAVAAVSMDLGQARDEPTLSAFLMENYPFNIRALASSDPRLYHASVHWSRPIRGFGEIRAAFGSDDKFPLMHHAGLALRSGDDTIYLLLIDEMLRVIKPDRGGQFNEIAVSPVNQMKTRFSLRIVRAPKACEVFMDDFLLMTLRDCPHEEVRAGIVRFGNGTPDERLSQLAART